MTYMDVTAPVEARVEDLLRRMTLAEKIGQVTQAEKNSIEPADIADLGLGSLLSGGGGNPQPNTPESWTAMVAGYQAEALQSRLGIPIIYGVDAVHGHNNVRGATIFPHNISLGAADDTDLTHRVARATAVECAATGVRWNFAPCIAVVNDVRWGRTFESFGNDTDQVSAHGLAYQAGLQDAGDPVAGWRHPTTVLATPKHYLGDGATIWGTSNMKMLGVKFHIDQGGYAY
jgi:beta-glucosidase